MKKLLIPAILIALLLCGCGNAQAETTPTQQTQAVTEQTEAVSQGLGQAVVPEAGDIQIPIG